MGSFGRKLFVVDLASICIYLAVEKGEVERTRHLRSHRYVQLRIFYAPLSLSTDVAVVDCTSRLLRTDFHSCAASRSQCTFLFFFVFFRAKRSPVLHGR